MCAVDNDGSAASEFEMKLLDSSAASASGGDRDEASSSSVGEASDGETSNNKVKMMCSFGGKILPRPKDGQLRYVGGETRIVVVKRAVGFRALIDKLSRLARRSVAVKYQLPNEDLDALISVTSDEDVVNMMDELERMKMRSGDGSAKLRVFLFPTSSSSKAASLGLVDSSDEDLRSPIWKLPRNQSGERSAKLMRHCQEEFGSFHHHHHQQQQQQQHLQEDFGSLKAYQQENHQCVDMGRICKACWPPRHPASPQRLNLYHQPQPQPQLHYAPVHLQQQNLMNHFHYEDHPPHSNFQYEDHQAYKAEFPGNNPKKFCYDRFHSMKPLQQQYVPYQR